MKRYSYVLRISIIAALGGLLFGFDTAVISGVEKPIQELFNKSGFWHGFTVAIALIGTVIGAMTAGRPADKFGRKQVLLFISVLYFLSALGSAVTSNWYGFMFFRLIGGLGVGASSVIGPMYIAETAPAKLRGRLVGLFQFNIVTGILLAFFSNFLINKIVDIEAWRYMLGIESLPALLFFILLFAIPATPRWLVMKNKKNEAKVLLTKLGSENPELEFKQILDSVSSQGPVKPDKLFKQIYKWPIILAILIALFNQMSGINVIMYYTPRIFELAGFTTDSALFQSVSIGFTNMIFTILAMMVIDRFGRKKLLLIGSVGMIVFLGIIAKAFLSAGQGGTIVLISLICYVAFFAFSQGAVIWVYISEVFPNRVRAKGQALGCFTHWIMAAMISWLFPVIAEQGEKGGGIAFLIFAIAMLIQFIVVGKWFPETKGKTLEELQKELSHR